MTVFFHIVIEVNWLSATFNLIFTLRSRNIYFLGYGGGKMCKCKDGFIGDGISCEEDPCAECSENAFCNRQVNFQVDLL